MRFRQCQHIRRQADFDKLRSEGIFKNAAGFFVKVLYNNGMGYSRLAVIVGKKIGEAHERNRIKRLFREIFRLNQQRLCVGDYLIIARKGIKAKFQELQESFLKMCASDPHGFIQIAIDGTAASGKSTTALALAKRYRLLNVNTGDHYRAMTYYLMSQGIQDASDSRSLEKIQNVSIGTQIDGISAHITIEGKIIEKTELRSAILNQKVAYFAKIPELRQRLKQYEQSLISEAKHMNFAGIVMEGRDICSVVMPDATVKLFLTADPSVRVSRRQDDGESDIIAKRDSIDHCSYAEDVHVIDTSRNSVEQVLDQISRWITR